MNASPRIASFAKTIVELTPDGASILEIGVGDGELARELAMSGRRVLGIDRNPRGSFPAIATSFEEYEAGNARFDCVVAQLVLHHAADLAAFVAKMLRLTKPGGIIAVDDYGWERSGDEAFRADRADLHTSETMLDALDRDFDRVLYRDHAYFDDGAGHDEIAFTYIGKPRYLSP